MLKNYFTIAIRNFWKHKVFSLINVSGLAIGISAALVIYLLVQFEFSFEKFRKDNDRIYRVVTDMTFPGESVFKNSGVPMPMPKALRADLTGIETATHFVTSYDTKVSMPVAGSQSPAEFKKQTSIIFADEFYFQLFERDWLAGSKQTALKDPYQVVLTEERAKTYFGNLPATDIIGKQITYDDSIKTTVSGIVKDEAKKATDFRFKEFISLATVMATGLKDHFGSDWGSINSASQCFVKLEEGTRPEQLNAQFPMLREKYRDKKEQEKDDTKHHLQSINDIHFNADYGSFDNVGRQAHKPTLYGLLAVALFLLLLGCINFINLTTAQSAQRAKEVGIRKTLGSGKRELIFQFLSETFLLTLIATILSIALLPWLLKIFSDFIPPEINFNSIDQPHVWIFLLLLVLVMTAFSGFYPALILTKFKPVTVLKNQLHAVTSKTRKAWLRKSLTVTQFVIAQFLVMATLVVSKQINFSLNKELGYKKDAIVYFRTEWNFFSDKPDDRRFALLEKIKQMPEVEKASLSSNSPAHQGASSTTLKVDNGKKEVELMTETMMADPEYFNIYKLKLVAGKLPAQSDTLKEYLVNESFTRSFGFTNPGEAIGKSVFRGNRRVPIVGVLKDFHTKSTHEPIKPLAYSSVEKNSYVINIALKSESGSPGLWKSALGKVEKEFKYIYPEDDFKYYFFDETIAAFYKKEQDVSRLLKWSAGLCIFISCLGLLGLVIYTTNTRTKEIGVRKVLGASVVQIVSLLSKDLLSLVLIAFIIATPLAWLAMNNWLQDFAYRTNISWWVFAACGVSMLLIALVLLSIRTVRAALTNPVKSLRTE
ncbi:MAG TPA: ABC transporter permease [Chitinophagaceae bacterium]|nr:ABC transporter permease [Chitinophagaceae bacterium]